MKKKYKNINEEVEKTLASWDNPDKMTVSPFFYTRIEERIRQLESPERQPSATAWKWAWQPALVVALLVLNGLTFHSALKENYSSDKRTEALQTLVQEYNLTVSSENYWEVSYGTKE